LNLESMKADDLSRVTDLFEKENIHAVLYD